MASYKKIKNKWTVVFDLPTIDGKRSQKRLSGYPSKREAELAYIAYKGEDKHIKPLGQNPFEKCYERFLNYQQTRVKESTYLDIMTNFKNHILPYFENLDIISITSINIIDWQSYMNNKELSFKFKDKIIGLLKTFFNYCVDIEEIIKTNPIKKQIKFINNKPKTEMLIYTPEEYMQFRTVISAINDKVLFDILYFTGMRKGELLGLKWTDFKHNTLSVTKTYSRKTIDNNWKLTSPKSKNAVREILLPEMLIQELIELKTTKKANDNDFIIGSAIPNNERYLDIKRNNYTEVAKIKKIRIHDFRHSHVSYLISCNVDIMTIAKRLGDRVETILETYAHLMPNKQQEMIEKINIIYKKMA